MMNDWPSTTLVRLLLRTVDDTDEHLLNHMLAPFLEPHLLDLHVHVLRYSLCLCEHLK